MTNPIENLQDKAPDVPKNESLLIKTLLFVPRTLWGIAALPQKAFGYIAGTDNPIGKTLQFLTNPLVLASALGTLAIGSNRGWFDELGSTGEVMNTIGAGVNTGVGTTVEYGAAGVKYAYEGAQKVGAQAGPYFEQMRKNLEPTMKSAGEGAHNFWEYVRDWATGADLQPSTAN